MHSLRLESIGAGKKVKDRMAGVEGGRAGEQLRCGLIIVSEPVPRVSQRDVCVGSEASVD